MKPILLFQGEQFEFSEKHSRLKNLLYGTDFSFYNSLPLYIEFFHQNDLKEANILELKRVLSFTAIDDTTIQVRHYEVAKISEAGITNGEVEFRDIGPKFDFKLRRNQIANNDLYKIACRKPKVRNVEKKKVAIIHLT